MTPHFGKTLIEDRRGRSPTTGHDLVAHTRNFLSTCMTQLRSRWAPQASMGTARIEPAALYALGDRHLAQTCRQGRPLGIAIFEFGDLREVRSLYGSRISRALMAQVLSHLTAVVGSRGVVARTASAQFTLLMPGSDRLKALEAIHRVMGTPVRVEFESRDDEIVLVPEFQVECADSDVESMEDLHRELCRDLEEIRLRKRSHQQYLTRERERHSTAASLPAEPRKALVHEAFEYRNDIPPTMPISLAAAGGFPRR
jgi:GGDEF domain-containing protein